VPGANTLSKEKLCSLESSDNDNAVPPAKQRTTVWGCGRTLQNTRIYTQHNHNINNSNNNSSSSSDHRAAAMAAAAVKCQERFGTQLGPLLLTNASVMHQSQLLMKQHAARSQLQYQRLLFAFPTPLKMARPDQRSQSCSCSV
jgi:hypothetical protein